MSGRNDRDELYSDYLIDESTRRKKSGRVGSFNPTSEDIKEAMKDFEIQGGRIKKTTPDFDKSYENFINLPVDTMGGADNFLMV